MAGDVSQRPADSAPRTGNVEPWTRGGKQDGTRASGVIGGFQALHAGRTGPPPGEAAGAWMGGEMSGVPGSCVGAGMRYPTGVPGVEYANRQAQGGSGTGYIPGFHGQAMGPQLGTPLMTSQGGEMSDVPAAHLHVGMGYPTGAITAAPSTTGFMHSSRPPSDVVTGGIHSLPAVGLGIQPSMDSKVRMWVDSGAHDGHTGTGPGIENAGGGAGDMWGESGTPTSGGSGRWEGPGGGPG